MRCIRKNPLLWGLLLCSTEWACSRPSAHAVGPEKEATRPAGYGKSDVAAQSASLGSLRPTAVSECERAIADVHDPRVVISEDENERLGLVCFGKAARYICPRSDGSACRGRLRVLVNESGEPLEQRFRQGRLCSENTMLYGCKSNSGSETIPFIHTNPIEFTASGLALVGEEHRDDAQQGGYFYVDSRYDQKLEALTVDGIPEPWLPLNVVRYRKEGKIGFLDLRNGIITGPVFNSAFSFYQSQGRTLVCKDCHPMRWDACAPPEAQCTGTAYLINEHGKRLLEKPSEHYAEYWWCERRPGEKLMAPSVCQ
jgi:hypothetical protein